MSKDRLIEELSIMIKCQIKCMIDQNYRSEIRKRGTKKSKRSAVTDSNSRRPLRRQRLIHYAMKSCSNNTKTKSMQVINMILQPLLFDNSILILRPHFIWKRKIFESNGFFLLQKLPSTKFICKLKGF